jgi:hypothetical protein
MLALLVLLSCSPPQGRNIPRAELILGKWYLNQWTSYHTLDFDGKRVFVDNSTDTVFRMNYMISNDTLVTWSESGGEVYRTRITDLTKETLSLNGFLRDPKERVYTRKQQDVSLPH